MVISISSKVIPFKKANLNSPLILEKLKKKKKLDNSTGRDTYGGINSSALGDKKQPPDPIHHLFFANIC